MAATVRTKKQGKAKKRESHSAPAVWKPFLASWSGSILIVLIVLGSARIVSTYSVLSDTSDEPAHIGAGMEWLVQGTYTFEPQHPPLARVMTAIGPYLDGSRYLTQNMWESGLGILYLRNRYDRTLALARAGILPFFWLGTCVVFFWARRFYGPPTAVLAAFIFSFLPAVLAHGGLATTDIPLTATMGAAFLALLIWCEKPALPSSLLLGLFGGLAVLAKLSALAFFPACAVAVGAATLVSRRPPRAVWWSALKPYALPLLTAMATAAVLIWAGYRFSFRGYPAPELFAGIQQVREHNQVGHASYFMGEVGPGGWWSFFPVVLSVKTPMPVLVLLAIGVTVAAARRRWTEIAFAAGLLAVCLPSKINIGVRHILPIYIAFSILAGVGGLWLLERRKLWTTGAAVGLLAWLAAGSLLSHPDYLPYFNFLAGDEPESIVVDSDLAWGQDNKRLAKRLRELGAKEVAFSPFTTFDAQRMGFPPVKPLDPRRPLPGWNAVDFSALKTSRLGLPAGYPGPLWPEVIAPTERVGKSTLLFYVPPGR